MIEFKDIRKSFNGQEIIKGIDLHIEKGETMVLVGGSGTGKSVTLKLMLHLLQPDSGEILIDGESVLSSNKDRLREIRKKFGVLFQSGALLNWMTVYENVALPLYELTDFGDDEIKEKVMRALDSVNLANAPEKYPTEISGGMIKRAALARAIIMEPDILLYDEPTSGLDPIMSRTIDSLIADLNRNLGITSVVVTHDLVSAFKVADRITLLEAGKVVASLTPEEFKKSDNPSVRSFIDAQFDGNLLL
ncbi:MAG: ATP-binding cassette domain-containing protein [Lentisphaeria bacterium]|nr:ATP-binding cassette domain-containing protein [Lentisphaeria bacterium]